MVFSRGALLGQHRRRGENVPDFGAGDGNGTGVGHGGSLLVDTSLPRQDGRRKRGRHFPQGSVKFGKTRRRDVINGAFAVKFGLEKRGVHGRIAPAAGRWGPQKAPPLGGAWEKEETDAAHRHLRRRLRRPTGAPVRPGAGFGEPAERGTIFEFSSGEGLLKWLERHAGELDLVFLDMEMGELDGMETARRLRAADGGLQLVFVTGYADHVFDGYSVGALGYLMKPPRQEQLEEVLDRARAALYRELDRAYVCRSGDTHYRIPHGQHFILRLRPAAGEVRHRGAGLYLYGKLDTVAAEVGGGFVRSTSGIWSGRRRWTGWRAVRRC